MKAREGVMSSQIYGDQLKQLYPVVEPNLSDSGSADCVLEFLVMAGQRSLPEVNMSLANGTPVPREFHHVCDNARPDRVVELIEALAARTEKKYREIDLCDVKLISAK